MGHPMNNFLNILPGADSPERTFLAFMSAFFFSYDVQFWSNTLGWMDGMTLGYYINGFRLKTKELHAGVLIVTVLLRVLIPLSGISNTVKVIIIIIINSKSS